MLLIVQVLRNCDRIACNTFQRSDIVLVVFLVMHENIALINCAKSFMTQRFFLSFTNADTKPHSVQNNEVNLQKKRQYVNYRTFKNSVQQ